MKKVKSLKDGVSERIRQILDKKGKNQQYLADEMETNKGYISRIIRGKANLTLQKIEEIEKGLGEPVIQITTDR